MNRSKVPKWIKREEPEPLSEIARKKSTNPMNFEYRDARRPRPAQNKGRGHQGGWAALKK